MAKKSGTSKKQEKINIEKLRRQGEADRKRRNDAFKSSLRRFTSSFRIPFISTFSVLGGIAFLYIGVYVIWGIRISPVRLVDRIWSGIIGITKVIQPDKGLFGFLADLFLNDVNIGDVISSFFENFHPISWLIGLFK